MKMKRSWIVKLLGSMMIAVLILSQSQCMLIAGKAAVAVGKEVYERVKDDDSSSDN